LIDLIAQRERNALFSREWLAGWGRRCVTLPQLIGLLARRLVLNMQGAKIDESSFVVAREIVGNRKNLQLGRNAFVGRARIALHASVVIGDRVVIGDEVALLTGSHDVTDECWKLVTGAIVIEDYAWIGERAIILPNVTVGRGAVIGAGSVVTKDVPPYSVGAGNPLRITGKTRPERLNYDPVRGLAPIGAWLGKIVEDIS
jgi:maltose O-acetyltransferase